ncbi:MAG: hypothetical protein RSI33_12600 [Clostridia bacterium]
MYEVWLNGRGLQDISASIRIVDVQEETPKLQVQLIDLCHLDGQRMASRRTQSRKVKVRFVVREEEPLRRRLLLDEVLRWVADGQLTTSAREGQYIEVKYTTLPNLSSVKGWAEVLEVTFTALAPYWQASDVTAAEVQTEANAVKSGTLCPPGTAGSAFLTFRMQNLSTEVIQTASVAVNGRSFLFTELGLEAGKTLVCDYDANGFLRLMAEGESKMNKRTGASADNLVLGLCQSNTISVQTDRAAKVTLCARGQWL